jgi:preprotein translocase subunit YajC
MHLALLELLFWLQAPHAAPSGGAAGVDPAAAAGDPSGMSCAMQGGMMAVFFVLFYFLMIRPENKRRQEQEDMLKSLRKGQKVRTSGGILGEIVSIDANEAVLAVGDKQKVNINILRSHIAGLDGPKADEKKAEDKKADEKKADDKKAEEKPAEKS